MDTDSAPNGGKMGEPSLFLTRILDVLCDGGDNIAFAHRSRSMSYQETFHTLRRLHATLKSDGIAPGQTVVITGGNIPETILLQIAAQLRGNDHHCRQHGGIDGECSVSREEPVPAQPVMVDQYRLFAVDLRRFLLSLYLYLRALHCAGTRPFTCYSPVMCPAAVIQDR